MPTAQNVPIWPAPPNPSRSAVIHNSGSAARLSTALRTFGNPACFREGRLETVCLCMVAFGVNVLFCRGQGLSEVLAAEL